MTQISYNGLALFEYPYFFSFHNPLFSLLKGFLSLKERCFRSLHLFLDDAAVISDFIEFETSSFAFARGSFKPSNQLFRVILPNSLRKIISHLFLL